MILKPKQMKKSNPGFYFTKDGRRILDITTVKGRALRDELIAKAWSRDNGLCGICGKYVCLLETTWDHIIPRGNGGCFRNDVLDNIRPAHFDCNGRRGSIRDYSEIL